MGLSSNILWHQTDLKGFNAILKSKCLVCSYSLETFLAREHKLAFPMISLSDIPVADIKEYMSQYGDYLIGFSREWVIKSGFNPVWYCEKSNLALKEHKKQILQTIDKNKNADISLTMLALHYGAYIKDIEGPLHVKSKNTTYSNYRFYDEREYRYVPDFNKLLSKGIKPSLFEEEYHEYKREKGNGLINHSVSFTFDDIKMLIVKTDNQVTQLKKRLKDEKHSIHVFSHKEIKQSIIGIDHQLVTEKK
jgi:hypothetical protein